ncbi:hypothetical protein [Novosphingobium mangrovi (ex Huang et al. 2023)]|uniref:DUF4164 domain-containing protein n=1 Tax=Novosphingobium mangrovi (ex Huang et al. 2023) TaxID=2976432 RepID=A0ABT2I898_9SPHN|nr:hypothetical protein [Novosphingobium mangrovi (ex Huang et al. 2023)]MCT2401034.1 hypothetical protein [Novosphingobium mangrovi (ex Huang et al. 2023)]
MEEVPIVKAVERIEAALARVEAASREAADLRNRHERLKASVSRSLEDLDRLIADRTE